MKDTIKNLLIIITFIVIYLTIDSDITNILYLDCMLSMTIVTIKTKTILNQSNLRSNLNRFFERKIKGKLSDNETIKIMIKALILDPSSDSSVQASKSNKFISLTPVLFIKNNDKDILLVKHEAAAGLDKCNNLYGKGLSLIQLIIEWSVVSKQVFKTNEYRNPWSDKTYPIENFAFPVTVDYGKYAHTVQQLDTNRWSYSDLFGFKDAHKMEFSVSLVTESSENKVYLIKFSIEIGPGREGKKYIEFTDVLNKITGLVERTFTSGTVLNSNNFELQEIKLIEIQGAKHTFLTPRKSLEMLKKEGLKNLFKFKLITSDIETYLDTSLSHKLLSIAFYTPELSKFYFINDYKSDRDLIKIYLLDLFNLAKGDYKVYFHNGAKFDFYLIFSHLFELAKELDLIFNPIYKDGEFIQLSVTKRVGNKSVELVFRDSFKTFSSGLAKLCSSLGVVTLKTVFPHSMSKKANFNYEGAFPSIEHFANPVTKEPMSIENYTYNLNQWKENNESNTWNFQNELRKYNINDCKALYEVIDLYNKSLMDKYGLDLNDFPTAPSLATGIYKQNYIPEHLRDILENKTKTGKISYQLSSSIQILSGFIEDFVREGYRGGHVDMYIPYGENVFHYDVTSEYPTVMKNCLMPYKVTNFFRGDLIKNRPDLWESKLGFYRAIVFCPTYIQHPILPYLLDGKCVYPAGWFEGIFYSSELKAAFKLGYHIEILEGYLFDGEYLFKDFITDMFETKNSLPSSDPMYALSKLSMNSLYGKFGMATDLSSYFVFNKADPLPPVESNVSLNDIVTVSENFELRAFESKSTPQANVAIAAATTAEARVFISQFKNNPDLVGDLYYTDTDSIFCSKELPKEFSFKGLGSMKLENIYKRFVSIGPKVYIAETLQGETICKIKGLSKVKLTVEQMIHLLENGKSLTKANYKLFRNFSTTSLISRFLTYELKATSSKRQFIFDSKGTLINTKPILVNIFNDRKSK